MLIEQFYQLFVFNFESNQFFYFLVLSCHYIQQFY